MWFGVLGFSIGEGVEFCANVSLKGIFILVDNFVVACNAKPF